MKYQKITNLLDNTTNQPFNIGTKTWVETNDKSRRIYNINSKII